MPPPGVSKSNTSLPWKSSNTTFPLEKQVYRAKSVEPRLHVLSVPVLELWPSRCRGQASEAVSRSSERGRLEYQVSRACFGRFERAFPAADRWPGRCQCRGPQFLHRSNSMLSPEFLVSHALSERTIGTAPMIERLLCQWPFRAAESPHRARARGHLPRCPGSYVCERQRARESPKISPTDLSLFVPSNAISSLDHLC